VSLALLATPPTTQYADRPPSPSPAPASTPTRGAAARHISSSLAGQLNREWAQLVAAPTSSAAPGRWASTCPALIGVRTLDDVLALIAGADGPARDAVLLALVGRAQSGDALAGRTVLQTMLGKAVRVAGTVAGRDDVRGDREEALNRAVAALWQAIATYPVARRPARVAANLALDTVAIAQRGHTGSSHCRRSCREVPVADVATVRPAARHDQGPDGLRGPADAELLTLLAWAVRRKVVDLDEARLLLQVYGVDEHGRPADARAVAEQAGLSWPALRQRCRRLARRIGAAAVEAGFGRAEQPVDWLLVAA
jgi:hypothetical protein